MTTSHDSQQTISLRLALENTPPFTLVAFRGGDIVAKFIRAVQKWSVGDGAQDFSHVGVVITSECCPFLKFLKPELLYVWECCESDSLPDLDTGGTRLGVQIRLLEDVVRLYMSHEGTAVAVCPLIHNPWLAQSGEPGQDTAKRRMELIMAMQTLHEQLKGRYYEINPLELCTPLFACLRPARDVLKKVIQGGVRTFTNMSLTDSDYSNKWVFCSELAAIIYQGIGVIPPEYKPCDVLPSDMFGHDREGMPAVAQPPMYITLP